MFKKLFLIAIFGAIFISNFSIAENKVNSETLLLKAFQYSENGANSRVVSSQIAYKALKKDGKIGKKPNMRVDYVDFYIPLKPIFILNYKIVTLEEEYMIEFKGCCVDNGIGAVIEINHSIKDLRNFALKNKCQLTEEIDFNTYLSENLLKFKTKKIKYAYLGCRESYKNQLEE